MTVIMNQGWQGFWHIFSGMKYVRENKKLIKWMVIPFLIEMAIVVYFLSTGMAFISGWVQGALAFLGLTGGGVWVGALSYILSAFFGVVYIVVVIYGTFLAAMVISSPFNALLAERTLMSLGAIEDRPFEFGPWLSLAIKMFLVSLVKAVVFAVFGILIFLLSFIPVLNVMSSYAAFMIMAFDSFDYSFEVKGMGLSQRFRWFGKNFWLSSGMAGSLGLTVMVPGLTLLLMPVSIVGAAMLFEKNQEAQIESRSYS